MSGVSFCDPYLWEDPRYLVTSIHKTDIKCASEMVNKACFVYAVSLLFAFVVSSVVPASGIYLIMGLAATIYLVPTFLKLREVESIRKTPASASASGYEEKEGFEVEDANTANPFENVTVDQYKYAPTRKQASGKNDLDAFFRVQWSSDPTDVFGKTQSQRMFYTTPNTTIPNDQKSYREWLYKIPGLTCKEGNGEACLQRSAAAVFPWLNL